MSGALKCKQCGEELSILPRGVFVFLTSQVYKARNSQLDFMVYCSNCETSGPDTGYEIEVKLEQEGQAHNDYWPFLIRKS